MPDWPLALRRAAPDHVGLIVHLIDDAAAWLRTQGTDQWAKPWPTRAERDRRVMAHLRAGKTWIAWDACTAAATITFDPDADPYWPQQQLRDPAVYIHRLVVSRHYAGAQLGAGLLDWAGRTARRDHGARWIRLNAWTTNHRLHQCLPTPLPPPSHPRPPCCHGPAHRARGRALLPCTAGHGRARRRRVR